MLWGGALSKNAVSAVAQTPSQCHLIAAVLLKAFLGVSSGALGGIAEATRLRGPSCKGLAGRNASQKRPRHFLSWFFCVLVHFARI